MSEELKNCLIETAQRIRVQLATKLGKGEKYNDDDKMLYELLEPITRILYQ